MIFYWMTLMQRQLIKYKQETHFEIGLIAWNKGKLFPQLSLGRNSLICLSCSKWSHCFDCHSCLLKMQCRNGQIVEFCNINVRKFSLSSLNYGYWTGGILLLHNNVRPHVCTPSKIFWQKNYVSALPHASYNSWSTSKNLFLTSKTDTSTEKPYVWKQWHC